MQAGPNKPIVCSVRGSDVDEAASLPAEGDARWLECLVESCNDAIISEDRAGRLVTWNAGAERLFGYAAAEATGRYISIVCPPESALEVRRIREQILGDQCVPPVVMHWRRKDGERIVVKVTFSLVRDSARQILGFSVIAREFDCTAAELSGRRQAEEALRQSDERTRSIVDNIVDGIITIDQSGIVQTVNTAVGRIFGYSPDELIGRNVSALMPEPYRGNHGDYLASYFRSGVAQIIGIGREVQGLRRDGSTFPLDLSVGEFHFAGRRYFTGVLRDVTERKALQAEVLSIAEREQQRIGQDLHDDVGQELTGVGLMAEALVDALQAIDSPEAELAAKIRGRLEHARERIRTLAGGLIPVEVDARGLMSALQDLCVRIGMLNEIESTFTCNGAVQVGDNRVATQLYRITQEAIANAIKHSQARRVDVELRRADGVITLEIQDDGIGISEQSRRGSGMGLRIMQYRAGLLSATLEVGAGAGGGTRVVCRISGGLSDDST